MPVVAFTALALGGVLMNCGYDHDLTGLAVIPLPEKVLEEGRASPIRVHPV